MAAKEPQHKGQEAKEQLQESDAHANATSTEGKEKDSGTQLDEVEDEELDKLKSLLDSKTITSSKINTDLASEGSSSKSSQRIELKGAEQKKWASTVLSGMLTLLVISAIVGLVFGGGYLLGAKKGSFFSLSGFGKSNQKVADQKKKQSEKQENVVQLDKAAVKIDVLNGNGISGESALVAEHLKKCGWTVQGIANADNHDYAQTIIRFKPGFEDAVKLAGTDISSFYPYTAKPDLGADSQVSLIIILGKDRKVTKSTIRVLNGNGQKGAAGQVAETLKKAGFKVKEVTNADRSDYPDSVISYKPGQKEAAEKIAQLVGDQTELNLKEDAALDRDIVILLGLK